MNAPLFFADMNDALTQIGMPFRLFSRVCSHFAAVRPNPGQCCRAVTSRHACSGNILFESFPFCPDISLWLLAVQRTALLVFLNTAIFFRNGMPTFLQVVLIFVVAQSTRTFGSFSTCSNFALLVLNISPARLTFFVMFYPTTPHLPSCTTRDITLSPKIKQKREF